MPLQVIPTNFYNHVSKEIKGAPSQHFQVVPGPLQISGKAHREPIQIFAVINQGKASGKTAFDKLSTNLKHLQPSDFESLESGPGIINFSVVWPDKSMFDHNTTSLVQAPVGEHSAATVKVSTHICLFREK